jgi:hypothetical protein
MLAIVVLLGVACSAKPSAPRYPESAGPSSSEQKKPEISRDPGPSPLASVAPTAEGWFDPSGLLVSLRAAERDATAQRAGLQSLADLPLYDLQVSIDPGAGTYEVEQETYVTNTYGKELSTLVFRLYGNPSSANAGPTRVRVLHGDCGDSVCHLRQEPPSVVTVSLQEALGPGKRLRIRFKVTGLLERVSPSQTGLLAQSLSGILGGDGGGQESTYGTMSVCEGFVSMGAFFPVLARWEGEAWERVAPRTVGDISLDALALIRARVDAPPLARVVTPGFAVRSVLFNDNQGRIRRRHEFAAAMVRDFAIFAGEGLDTVERRAGEVVVRSTFRPESRKVGERVAELAASALEVFERRFGPYPYRVLEVVEAPLKEGAGGMEYSGMAVLASMLYRPFGKDDPLGGLLGLLDGNDNPMVSVLDDTLEFTTAHEVAHQWWHVLVGSDSSAYPFVDESLAQYSTLIYFEDRYGKERARQLADSQVRLNYIGMRLMGQGDGPVMRPASSFSPLSYAGLVYGKGPFFYREARKTMGDEAFFSALRRYADDHRFRMASSKGPMPYLTQHGREVSRLSQRWLEQTHGDTDLGPVTVQAVLEAVLGKQAAAMTPAIEQLLRTLGTSSPDQSGPSPKDSLQMLQQLERMLDSF